MDCSNRKPPVDLSGVVVAAVQSSPEQQPAVAGTWHPHVYGNPPRTPTAHGISDILGWTKTGSDEQPLNLSTARRTNGTVLDLKIKRKGTVIVRILSYLLGYHFFCNHYNCIYLYVRLGLSLENIYGVVGGGSSIKKNTRVVQVLKYSEKKIN